MVWPVANLLYPAIFQINVLFQPTDNLVAFGWNPQTKGGGVCESEKITFCRKLVSG